MTVLSVSSVVNTPTNFVDFVMLAGCKIFIGWM